MVQLQTPPRSRWRNLAGHESGQDLVEFALVLPVLALLIFGIIQAGILVWNYNTVSNAAREGARAGIVMKSPQETPDPEMRKCPGSQAIVAAACALTTGLTPASSVEVDVVLLDAGDAGCTTGALLGCIQVTVSYPANLIFRLGGTGAITLSSTATMAREQ